MQTTSFQDYRWPQAIEKMTGGSESMALGSLITACSGLLGVVLAKCRCVYRRTDEGVCLPSCGFSDKPLTPEDHQIEVFHEQVDDIPVLIITKTNT